MNVSYACPSCHEGVRTQFDETTRELTCPHCQYHIAITPGVVAGNHVERCLVCPSSDLYVRKDFPQRVGVLLVAIGIIGSSIAWYYADVYWTFGILFATALVDVMLYLMVGDALMCYRCHAQYRSIDEMETHGQFDLETHEKYRQLAARLESAK